ncbi:Nibrin Nijmegen breakage syndrome protein 1 -like protein [Triplophysa tibetana]|uniref:Nibrin n=1 Tax=Triplophysa tibetana TaxID=1572043 RepID=A0A5A9N3X0_9TELE|nr:Nibrin Nijmegen breakage syndrome protein 1 -like protein [Triplophysa tibetana]
MWKLQPTESGGQSLFLLSGQTYVVGRKNCEILLSNDQSISREHARLTVTEQGISLKDSSKYGTFVNDEKLEAGSTKSLQTGDSVTFGVFQSKFRLEKESIVVCSSCVDNEGKVSLSQHVRSIGGRLVNSWTPDCTHLVMPTVKVTIKTICALLCCRPIVKPEYFSAFSKAVQQKLPLPKPERFRPQVDEPTLTKEDLDLGARPERKSLFKGKTFVFFNSKQARVLIVAVSCGGAVSQLLEEGSLPLSLLESSSTCVVDMISDNSQALIPPTTKKWVDSVSQILQRKGLRFITESEIGLAAIHLSNQTYCNPCSSLHSESVKKKAVMASETLSQYTAVDETALAAPSQNITAYVVNTEVSHDQSRIETSGICAVGETPEKTQPAQRALQLSKLSKTKPSLGPEPSTSRIITETVISPESYSGAEPEQRLKTGFASSGRGLDGSSKVITPLKQSSQKQSAFTNYFQPVSKKRQVPYHLISREDSASSLQSEAKISRKDDEVKEDEMMKISAPLYAQQSSSNSRSHKTSSTAQNQRNLSASLGVGSDPSVAQPVKGSGSTQSSGSKKRKEPEQDVPSCPDEAADLDLSLEELESIMSEEMDEPLQITANKKQCLESGRSSAANNPQLPNQQKSKTNQQISASNLQLDRKGLTVTNQVSESQSKRLSNQAPNSELETHSLAIGVKRPETDVKEEEVSFVTSRTQNGVSQDCKAAAKQEVKTSGSLSGTENDPELPQRLVQIEFMSLTVSNSSRSRPIPLQTNNSNGKNVKRFCKTSVPGLKGLPNIIGGSDLVAHNRSKNSELEEWLRHAAEEEKQNEREETLGDDLFRYNPRTTRR